MWSKIFARCEVLWAYRVIKFNLNNSYNHNLMFDSVKKKAEDRDEDKTVVYNFSLKLIFCMLLQIANAVAATWQDNETFLLFPFAFFFFLRMKNKQICAVECWQDAIANSPYTITIALRASYSDPSKSCSYHILYENYPVYIQIILRTHYHVIFFSEKLMDSLTQPTHIHYFF